MNLPMLGQAGSSSSAPLTLENIPMLWDEVRALARARGAVIVRIDFDAVWTGGVAVDGGGGGRAVGGSILSPRSQDWAARLRKPLRALRNAANNRNRG
jgi:hypothetical protein